MSVVNDTNKDHVLSYEGLEDVVAKIKNTFVRNTKQASEVELGLIKALDNPDVQLNELQGHDAEGNNYPVQIISDGTAFVNMPKPETVTVVDEKVKNEAITDTTKPYFLLGQSAQNTTSKAGTDANCYIKEGSIYSSCNKVLTEANLEDIERAPRDESTWSYVHFDSDGFMGVDVPTIPEALKNPNALTIQANGTTIDSYDGSSAKTVNITAANLGLSNVFDYKGITTTPISDGSTTKPIVINDESYTQKVGDVVIVNGDTDKEYFWNGTKWEELGRTIDLSGYATTSQLQDYLPLAGGTLTGQLDSRSIIPTSTNTYNLGTDSLKWSNVYATNFIGNIDWDYIQSKPNFATVATSGSYNDLSDKPTIPTVNNGTLTITQNGTSVGTFTANQSGDVTIALTDTNTDTQSDWNETNNTSAAYIKNKTHGEQLINVYTAGSYTHTNNITHIKHWGNIYKLELDVRTQINSGPPAYVTLTSPNTILIEDIVGGWISVNRPVTIIDVYKLDEKYLPDSVLNVNVPQSDWNEQFPSSPSYINNRTHYIEYATLNGSNQFELSNYTDITPYIVNYNGSTYTLVEGENQLSWGPPMKVILNGTQLTIDKSSYIDDAYPLNIAVHVKKLNPIYLNTITPDMITDVWNEVWN